MAPADRDDDQTLRLISVPKAGIAYAACFNAAVERMGIEVIDGSFSGRWLWQTLRRGDWVHLHWPSFQYSSDGGKWTLARSFLRWCGLMLLIRLRGARISWTAHNILPHERSAFPAVDVIARLLVIHLADAIFCHGANAAAMLKARFPTSARKTREIPHGNWIGYYPTNLARDDARRALNVERSSFVFLFFGAIRPYKNIEALIEAFGAISEPCRLIVAGKPDDASYAARIRTLAARDSRILVHPRSIPDCEVQRYFLACDAVVLPYREVLTSGVAMLALSFGRPVVSVDLGFLRDVITEQTGILCAPANPDALLAALRGAMRRSFDEAAIMTKARSFTFEDAAGRVVGALQAVGSMSADARERKRE